MINIKIGKLDNKKILTWLSSGVLVCVILALSYFRTFDEFEFGMIDLRYKLRPEQSVDENIVIIHIGDNTIGRLGEWPIPRSYHGLLVKALRSAGVKEIVFDVFFSEETKDDKGFADSVQAAGNVFLPYVFEMDLRKTHNRFIQAKQFIAPLIDVLKSAAYKTGFVNVQPDVDGKVRKVLAFIEYQGSFYPQLALAAALDHFGVDLGKVEIIPGRKIIVKEGVEIPLDTDSGIIVNFPAGWGKAYRHYSYVEIIQSFIANMRGEEPELDLDELKDAVCFVGFTAAASPDAHPSPLQPLYPGVGVHASVYNSIMKNTFLRRVSPLGNLVILIFMLVGTAFVSTVSRKSSSLISIGLIICGYSVIAIALFCFVGIWIDMFYPLVTIVGIYIIYTFKKYLSETKKRELLEKELDIAKDIQQSFLPKDIPDMPGLDIYAEMLTARQVGGDLYDVVQFDEDRIGIMLGDVSGKGVPAALFMARVVSVFKTYVREGQPEEVLKLANDVLSSEATTGLFVTIVYMIFNTKEKTVCFASGGHNPSLFVDPEDKFKWMDVEEGMPLGLIEGNYSGAKMEYKPGSVFVLYTDGVTEAMNVNSEMFEEERLLELTKKMKNKSAKEIVECIHKEVEIFAGKAPQHDDITVLVVKT